MPHLAAARQYRQDVATIQRLWSTSFSGRVYCDCGYMSFAYANALQMHMQMLVDDA